MSLEVASLRAVAHPVRLQILSLLTGAAMSASEIARELDITQANASYHLRKLAAVGQVVEAGEERIRGGVAKRYRHPWEDAPELAPRNEAERLLYVQSVASEMVRRAKDRPRGGKGEFTDAELWVEPEVWRQVVDQVLAASHQLHAAAQRPHADGTILVNMTAGLFEMKQRAPRTSGDR